MSALLVMIVVQISTSLCRNYQENSDLQLAKTKISKLFYLYSMKSFTSEKNTILRFLMWRKRLKLKFSFFIRK
ncbi:Uncharacterised protein [Fusobacterium necrophorum subsp. necrophorum]|nr:Uncharacterised protein [Fusobacterium necrophorum subsp. necrophorum]